MNPNFHQQELTRLFLKVFEGVPRGEHAKMRRGVQPWSSLRHIELVTLVEDSFKVRLSVDDVLRADSFDLIIDVISELQNASHNR